MDKNELIRRYVVYIAGLYVFSLGIALVARSTLGATPVSSWAYAMSVHANLSYGTYSFLIHLAMIAYQIVIMYKHGLKKEWFNILLQLPFSLIFGIFLDVNMFLTSSVCPSSIYMCFMVLAVACLIHAFGVFMQVCGKVTMMSAEGFVFYTCQRWNLRFWRTKIKFDLSMVMLAIITSLTFDFSWASVTATVGIGTAIDAAMVGRIYKFYAKRIKLLNQFIKWNRDDDTTNLL